MDLDELLSLGVEQGASDLHLSAGLPPLVRVDGDIRRLSAPPLGNEELAALIQSIMDEPLRRTFAAGAEADFAFELAGVSRFRVNAFHHSRGLGTAFRTVPASIPSLSALGGGEVLHRLSRARQGLILITGATGSGKSTTLAALLDCINQERQSHILTIEDPIEFVHHSRNCLVHQREAGRHTPGFAAALRAALREDPDVIMVGEMRDQETMSLALTAAETGHLVLGTLHTPSASGTINRVVDMFPPGEKSLARSMLAESLQAVVSQRLVRRLGGGRVAAFEIMVGSSAVRRLVREDKPAQLHSAMQSGRALGTQTLEQHLRELAAAGLISPEAAEPP